MSSSAARELLNEYLGRGHQQHEKGKARGLCARSREEGPSPGGYLKSEAELEAEGRAGVREAQLWTGSFELSSSPVLV